MQTVVITGAGRGIGKALTEKFLESGYRVIGTSTSGGEAFSHENFQIFPLDLRSAESIKTCIQQLTSSGVQIDIVVNNAGTLLDEDEKTLKTDLLRRTLEVNLIGTADFSEQVLPLVNKGGHIVMLSSSAGSIGRTGNVASRYPSQYPAYKISKAALNMYMRTLAVRLKESDITVSSVHPGWARTDMGGEERRFLRLRLQRRFLGSLHHGLKLATSGIQKESCLGRRVPTSSQTPSNKVDV